MVAFVPVMAAAGSRSVISTILTGVFSGLAMGIGYGAGTNVGYNAARRYTQGGGYSPRRTSRGYRVGSGYRRSGPYRYQR